VKVLTVLGTRPEIIRLSRVIATLDARCDHVLVHTGQNADPALSDLFFAQLGVRPPDHALGISGARFGHQAGRMFLAMDDLLTAERPDRLLILGDTNSGLCAILAARAGIPVYHMEAGNRCYDDRVPEEINRRVIDHSSDVLMPYTERSRQNLLREGIASERIFVTGNPILEVLRHYGPAIAASDVLTRLALAPGSYILVTMHRAENVDPEPRLRDLTAALAGLHRTLGLPVIVSTHPRTRSRMEAYGIAPDSGGVRFLPPFGFFDFVALERAATCVVTDSGTVQEECAILKVPNVTIRDVTERPETVECGSNIHAGAEPETVLHCVATALALKGGWSAPAEYLVENVSDTVVRIVLGYLHRRRA
jgi:UDP-N-acetylglucosamine 2-epimerase (non-hydrolysing)